MWTGLALGSAATLTTTWIYHRYFQAKQKEYQVRKRNRRSSSSLPVEIREEQLSRHTLYFGEDGMRCLKNSRILVVGLGGVGSHTALMLARGGVGYLRLVDFDQVSLSSLNRHACAVLEDVGTPKTTCLVEYCRKICPDPQYLELDGRVCMFNEETADELLESSTDEQEWDLVIDCIDDVPTKALLLFECLKRSIPCYSCMGAGGKADVTRLHISDLRTASRDPLATKLRQHLKKLHSSTNSNYKMKDDFTDNMDKISIVYSSEKVVAKLADFTEEQKEQGVENFGAVDGMRIRILPVLGTMPAVMGQTLAALALTQIGRVTFQPVTGERVGKTVRHKLLQNLQNREQQIVQDILAANQMDRSTTNIGPEGMMVNGIWIGRVQVDMDDMEYLYEIWRNRCAITQARLGATLRPTRWDKSKPSTCDNLVLMSAEALKKFDKAGGKDSVDPEIARVIQDRLATCIIDR